MCVNEKYDTACKITFEKPLLRALGLNWWNVHNKLCAQRIKLM
jgi:hypothetical protein